MPRIELPNGNWADLREVDGIPRKSARAFRKALYAAAAPAIAGVDTEASEAEKAAAATQAVLAGGMDGMEDMAEALVFAVVADWSYGPIDQDTLDTMPDAAVDAIYGKAVADNYIDKLMPDFGVSADEESPTSPS